VPTRNKSFQSSGPQHFANTLSDFDDGGYLSGEMQSKSDAQLLREYAEQGDDAAFTEIVNRHTNLVYSAALRQVESPDLAAEICQQAFIGLARGAQSLLPRLTHEASLAGWLCRSARNLWLNLRRDEFRRHTREKQAMEQHESTSETAPDWDQLRPVLDGAMDELNESDYEALVLRFFKNQDLRTVGQALGVNDDTAQKRISRALDKLRERLARRGITTTAGALSLVIAANAVHAAPTGLTATISSATTFAGSTAAATTTTAITKTIAMTTLQKTVITATVAVLAGAGMYEARRAAQLRDQVQALQQQQAPLTEQIQRLQSERAEATNRLATATAEIAQLKSGQNQAELLKLRGQAGTLRQQLVSLQAKINLPSSGLEKIMADPAMKEMVDQQARREIKLRYADLFRELKLSPERIEKFAVAYANSGLTHSDTDIESRLRSLLGDDSYVRFKEFTQEVPARTTVKLLNSQLGASQLTDEQDAQLLQVVKAEPYDLIYGIEGDLNPAFFGAQDQVDNYVQQAAASNQRIVQQAGAFLAPDQLAALNSVLTNALNVRIAQAVALVQKH
jgi:RNA polymerase sigma factor (sigma-70 family)